MSEPLLELRGLDGGYDGVAVVRGLDLVVRSGEVVALLGPNGAGKTTTLLTISGLLEPIEGEILVFGESTEHVRPHRLARCGVAHVPEDRALFYQLTVGENLLLGRRKRDASHLERVLGWFPALAPLVDRRAGLPCHTCGSLIVTKRLGRHHRDTWWCPKCQTP